MQKVFDALGGRKVTIVIFAILLIALSKPLGLDEETVNRIIVMALGGTGSVALVDGAHALAGNKKPRK